MNKNVYMLLLALVLGSVSSVAAMSSADDYIGKYVSFVGDTKKEFKPSKGRSIEADSLKILAEQKRGLLVQRHANSELIRVCIINRKLKPTKGYIDLDKTTFTELCQNSLMIPTTAFGFAVIQEGDDEDAPPSDDEEEGDAEEELVIGDPPSDDEEDDSAIEDDDGEDEGEDLGGPVAMAAAAAPSVASSPSAQLSSASRAMLQEWLSAAKANVAEIAEGDLELPTPAGPVTGPPVTRPAVSGSTPKQLWRESVLSAQNPRVALGAAMHEGGGYNLSAEERAQLVSEVRHKHPSLNRSAGGPLSPEASPPAPSSSPGPPPAQKGLLSSLNSPMGRMLIMMLLAGGAGGYSVKRWSHRYDGLSDKQIDALPMNRLKKMVLKASRAGRRWFGGAPHQKPSEQMHPLVQQVARSGPSEAAAQKEWFYRRWMNGARNWWQHRRGASAA